MNKSLALIMLQLLTTMFIRANEISVYELRCGGLISPVGIESVPALGWKIHSSDRNFLQSAYRIQFSDNDSFTGKLLWDSGKVSSDNSTDVRLTGIRLRPMTEYFWRVRIWGIDGSESAWSRPAKFVSGVSDGWNEAEWISMEEDRERIVPAIHFPDVKRVIGDKKFADYTLPLFRKEFTAGKDIKSAYLFVCGLGHFEASVNGCKVGNHFLDPGWTKYDREAQYVGFDISGIISEGKNAIWITLGNGMYNIPAERYYKFVGSFGAPKLISILRVVYNDGHAEDVVSDTSWECRRGPITFSSIFGGEDYDARLLHDNSRWEHAISARGPANVKPQLGTALEIKETLSPNAVSTNKAGHTLYDFGQNMSGIPQITVKGQKGQRIIMHPGELIDADSCINQSASGTPYYFTYTLRGDGVETWAPQFSYYGFRYIEIETDSNNGYSPEILDVKAHHTSAENQITGSFHCSEELFNRIYRLIDNAMSSNTASVLTDCPHREKLGWLEQTHLMQNSLSYRRNMQHIYKKQMSDMAASQLDNGAIPTIAPEYVRFEGGFEDSPEWGAAFILCPYQAWQWYGDTDLLRDYYSAMKHYTDYLATRAVGNIIAYGLGDWYDIGPGEPGFSKLTTPGVTATAIYFQVVTVMAKIARILGNESDAERYSVLAAEIRKAFNERFFNPTEGYYDRNSQTANAMPLALGIVEDQYRPTVARHLADDIISRGYALTAGDIGYRYLLKALEDCGLSDIIYSMNSGFTSPGYGWQLAHGATALTESWQAYGSVSNNHMMLGHLMEWLFGSVGGIRFNEEEGSRHIMIKPMPVGALTSAETTVSTPYGEVECRWKITDGNMSMALSIPANSRATVVLPGYTGGTLTDFGREITPTHNSTLSIGSGTYLLEYPITDFSLKLK